jgi:hypothetical protein
MTVITSDNERLRDIWPAGVTGNMTLSSIVIGNYYASTLDGENAL